jgi:hypothetical protein
MARGMRDWLLEKFGAEEADRALPDYVVQSIETQRERELLAEQPNQQALGFAAPQQPEVPAVDPNEKAKQAQQTADFAAREAELAQREQAIAAAEAALANEKSKAQRAELANFAAELVKEGKLLPREQEGAVAFMTSLTDSQTVSFAAPDGADKQLPQAQWFRDFVSSLPARVDFAERGAAGDSVDFANDSVAMANAATQYQAEMAAKGITVSATDAVKHVNGAK